MNRKLLCVLLAAVVLGAWVAGAFAASASDTWGPNSPGYVDPMKFIKSKPSTVTPPPKQKFFFRLCCQAG